MEAQRAPVENSIHSTDYNVGYGKPPKNTRFEKGQSGNPKGRPKGKGRPVSEKQFLEIFREEGDRQMQSAAGDMTMLRALIRSTLTLAIKGIASARRTMMPYLEKARTEQDPVKDEIGAIDVTKLTDKELAVFAKVLGVPEDAEWLVA